MFYKKEENNIVSGENVATAQYTLTEDTKTNMFIQLMAGIGLLQKTMLACSSDYH